MKSKKIGLFIVGSILYVSSITAFAATVKTSIYNISEIITLVSKNYSGEITKVDLETGNNKNIYYEVDILNVNKKTELIIDAKTGKILKEYSEKLDDDEKYLAENFIQDSTLKPTTKFVAPKETSKPEKSNQVYISEEKAKKIALDKVGGGKVTKFKLDNDDSTILYEVEVLSGEYEYEIDIDAITGEIISFDKDHIYD